MVGAERIAPAHGVEGGGKRQKRRYDAIIVAVWASRIRQMAAGHSRLMEKTVRCCYESREYWQTAVT